MKLLKSLPAALATAGLMLAQPALAQSTAADVPVDELGVPGAAQPLVFILGITLLAVIAGLIFEDNNDEMPTSP